MKVSVKKTADVEKMNKPSVWNRIKRCWQLYVLLLPAVVYLFIFNYLPMAGIQIAFRDYKFSKGMWGSVWLKKIVQSLTYAPYFISTVVLVSMLSLFLSPSTGVINKVIEFFGGTGYDFMGSASAFRSVYVISGIWQGAGWSAIIFIAALAGIDPQLHEAAEIDGANRLQRIWHINLPGIIPTAVTVFILNCGSIMSVGFEKVYLMQNSMNQTTSEIIATYVYKMGILHTQYSYTTAIGLFNSLINLFLLIIANQISKKVADISLF